MNELEPNRLADFDPDKFTIYAYCGACDHSDAIDRFGIPDSVTIPQVVAQLRFQVAEDESNDLCDVLRPYRFGGRIVRKAQKLTIAPNMIALIGGIKALFRYATKYPRVIGSSSTVVGSCYRRSLCLPSQVRSLKSADFLMLRTVEPIAARGNSSLPCPIQPLVLPNPLIEQAGLGRRATWRATGCFRFASLRIEMATTRHPAPRET